jgi:CheY-like chemotaxis protein
MQQTQKLESLGVLAGGVAHDFNNLLMVILGNTELALARTPSEAPARGFIESVETAAHRAADLTNQMLAYSGKGRFIIEGVNLSQLVGEMGHLLGTVVAKNAEVRYELASDLPLVQADATQVRQVVMNLITNASDAIGAGPGTITIATRSVSIAAGTPLSGFFDHSLQPGRYVVVEVADTGSGMDQATLARIFDPFFTTKHTGRGLGLASVLGIVQGHGGGIRVDSRPGEGTAFSVLLPASPDAAGLQPAPDPARPPAEAAAGAPRLVLVVDDEESVRATAQAMLQDHGFAVVAAADGVEGVELFQSRHAELAAVLLDMSMPRMGGEEAFRLMRAVDPSVPVLLMSGYDESEAVGRFTGTGLAGFIRKPYRISALIDRLREAIAARQGTRR